MNLSYIQGTTMNHIAIATKELESMREFYSSLPGMNLIRTNHFSDGELRSVWFRYNNSDLILMLEKENFQKAPFALVFDLKSSGRSKQEIKELNLYWDGESEFTIYFKDPEGNRLGYSDFMF